MSEWRLVWHIVRRELRDQLRDWRIILPIIILTIFFPLLMNVAAVRAADFVSQYGADLVAARMVPFFVLVVGFFPITVSLVVALEAFVGEKERGTLEPLLSSPLADWQLYAGKFFSALFLPLAAAFLDIAIYLFSLWVQDVALPPLWILGDTLLLTAAEALVMVSGAVFISTQSTTVRGANLLASFVVIPMSLVLQAESVVLFWGDHVTFLLSIGGLLIMALMMGRLGLAHFQREHLLNRRDTGFSPVDLWRKFWRQFKGEAQSLRDWYRGIGQTLWRARFSFAVVVVFGLVSVAGAWWWVHYQADIPDGVNISEIIDKVDPLSLPEEGGAERLTFSFLLLHNLKALALQSFLGLVSFSVLEQVLFMVNMAFLGAVLGLISLSGHSAGLVFLYGVLPHGIFEISAMLIVAATLLELGARLVTPQVTRVLNDVLLDVFADFMKIFIGLVLPLLVLAAWVEANLTPSLLNQVMR